MPRLRALVTTIQPVDGGVPTMTKWFCKLLEEIDISPVLAWYSPWRNQPTLSVPSYRILRQRPGSINEKVFGQYDGVGIGSWLPELEFTHYLPTSKWKEVISSCDLHLSVSGNPLCALPYVLQGLPFLAWIATPWEADRKNRVNQFSWPRRILDSTINKPFLKKLERDILRCDHGRIIALSKYTSAEFKKISGRSVDSVMLMPINRDIFYPLKAKTVPWRIGFTGRYCDPRKNIRLLLEATKIISDMDGKIELVLVGERNYQQLLPTIEEYRLQDKIKCYSHMEAANLASVLQTLDLFVIPSFQEGLCISALEAMACGVPVISTRCGGPEEYVLPNKTGEIVEREPSRLAQAIISLCMDRERRSRLSINCSSWIEKNASETSSRSIFRLHISELIKERRFSEKSTD